MASASYTPPQPDQIRSMINELKTLVNQKLKDILREEGLAVSGVKNELQSRIIAHIENLSNAGDLPALNRLHDLIKGSPRYRPQLSPYANYTPPSSASPQYSSPIPKFPQSHGNNSNMSSSGSYSNKNVNFKHSPFYQIIRPLASTVECKAREHTRDTARIAINLSSETAEQLNRDANIRIMVFCAAEHAYSQSPSEISFPHQVELKCNSDEVKANLRGLKNKPGSTRPADITSLIRKKANYNNVVEMVYALTQKGQPAVQKFFLVVNLVERRPVDSLVTDVKRFKITTERVLLEMNRKRNDADIEATSSVLSLKCPLSAMRIAVPCRSRSCQHNACFDAASYLLLQEQAPTWTCPICNKAAPFENLQLDQYVEDILKSTTDSIEQVTVEPDGQWHTQGLPTKSRQNGNPTPDDEDDDDDLIELPDNHRVSALKQTPKLLDTIRTPPMSSREPSTASSAPRSNKRPASEVIDLTLSDDDDAPPAKIKRPSMSSSESFRRAPYESFSFDLPRPNPPNYSMSPFNTNL